LDRHADIGQLQPKRKIITSHLNSKYTDNPDLRHAYWNSGKLRFSCLTLVPLRILLQRRRRRPFLSLKSY